MIKRDENILLLSYDPHNAVTLPKAGISSFFYKKRVNLYNLTAKTGTQRLMFHLDRINVANAFISILKKIIPDHPDIKHVMLE